MKNQPRCLNRKDLQSSEEENQDLKIALFEVLKLSNSDMKNKTASGLSVEINSALARVMFLMPTDTNYNKLMEIKYGQK